MTEVAVRKDSEPEIDEELLEEARRHLGDVAPNEALNAALRLFVDHWRARRRQGLENLQRMADEGAFDFSLLEEADR